MLPTVRLILINLVKSDDDEWIVMKYMMFATAVLLPLVLRDSVVTTRP